MPSSSKNAPRFLDYRRSPLPLDVALSFALISKPINNERSNAGSDGDTSARELIISGRVRVNDAAETNCHRLVCRNNDRIVVVHCNDEGEGGTTDGERVEWPVAAIAMPRYFVCYKPRGVVCSSGRNEGIDREDSVLISEWLANVLLLAQDDGINENDHVNVDITKNPRTEMPLCGEAKSIKSVGRLDEESEGLILLTNDGSFSRLLCDPEFGLKKTYRVVVRGRGYSRLVAELSQSKCDDERDQVVAWSNELGKRVAEMIESQANIHNNLTGNNNDTTKPHFPFESCHVLDAGKLPTQHCSDDSYYALVDLVLREGKRHAVRRIIKNAEGGHLRVCYLSRISVEGLERVYDAVKPETIIEAQERGFMPGGRHRKAVAAGRLMACVGVDDCPELLHPGDVMELRGCDVDRIFALRR